MAPAGCRYSALSQLTLELGDFLLEFFNFLDDFSFIVFPLILLGLA